MGIGFGIIYIGKLKMVKIFCFRKISGWRIKFYLTNGLEFSQTQRSRQYV